MALGFESDGPENDATSAGLRRRRRRGRHRRLRCRQRRRAATARRSSTPTSRPSWSPRTPRCGARRGGRGEDPARLGRHLPRSSRELLPRLAELRDRAAPRPRPRRARRHGRLVARARGHRPHPRRRADRPRHHRPAPGPGGAGRPARAHGRGGVQQVRRHGRDRQPPPGVLAGVPRRRADRGRGGPRFVVVTDPGSPLEATAREMGAARLPGRPRGRRPLQRADRVRAGARRRWPAWTSPSCSTRPTELPPTLAERERQPGARAGRRARRRGRRRAATRSRSPTTAPASSASATGPSSSSPSRPARTARASCRSSRDPDRPGAHGERRAAPCTVGGALPPAGVPGGGVQPDVAVNGPLGAQFLAWEFATAVAGRVLGINPFDQPNVTESRSNTDRILAERAAGRVAGVHRRRDRGVRRHGRAASPTALGALLDGIDPHGYLAVLAYLDRFGDAAAAQRGRCWPPRTGRPVTFGWGPRFLHSTGQYHKGGPQVGAFLQITGASPTTWRCPGKPYTFGELQAAQAAGDRQALAGRGRPVLRLHLTDRAAGIAQLLRALAALPAGRIDTERRLWSNPLRDPAGPPAAADPGALRAGHLRRDRRPGPQEADAGHLRPGQPGAAAAGLRGARLRPARLGRRRLRVAGEEGRPASTPAPRGGKRSGPGWPATSSSCRARSTTTRRSTTLAPTLDELRDIARHPRQRRVLPVDPATGVPDRAQAARTAPGWPTTRKSGGWRRVVVEKPFGNDLRLGQGAQRPRRRRVHRAGRVPHRPLPGQGDRPEHPGAALRQRRCSSRCGTATTSTRCRSPWPRTSASAPGPGSTTPPAPPATCCRTTCCSCSR